MQFLPRRLKLFGIIRCRSNFCAPSEPQKRIQCLFESYFVYAAVLASPLPHAQSEACSNNITEEKRIGQIVVFSLSCMSLTMSVYRSARFHKAPWKKTFISACVFCFGAMNFLPIRSGTACSAVKEKEEARRRYLNFFN